MTEKLEVHPICASLPMMTAEELEGLTKSIRERGCREPIVLFEGKILAGRHRYRVCQELGIEPPTRFLRGGENPLLYVIDQDFHRRHLTTSQRAMWLAAAEKRFSGTSQKTPSPKGGSELSVASQKNTSPGRGRPKKAQSEAAKAAKVGKKDMAAARTVVSEGTPETIKDVEAGKVGVRTAAAKTKAEKDREKLAKAALKYVDSAGLDDKQVAALAKKTHADQLAICTRLRKGVSTPEAELGKARKTDRQPKKTQGQLIDKWTEPAAKTEAPPEPPPKATLPQFKKFWERCDDKVKASIGRFVAKELKEHQRPPSRNGFLPPTLAEVREYCEQRNKGIDPEEWHAHYAANGWRVGKDGGKPMKDWKSAVITWEKRKAKEEAAANAPKPRKRVRI